MSMGGGGLKCIAQSIAEGASLVNSVIKALFCLPYMMPDASCREMSLHSQCIC
jgi:hypothetical protein